MAQLISTPKFDLAQELARYSRKEQRQIFRAARHLSKFLDLTNDYEGSRMDEGDEMLLELEEEIKADNEK